MSNDNYKTRFDSSDRQTLIHRLNTTLGLNLAKCSNRRQIIFKDQNTQKIFVIIGMTHDWLGIQKGSVDEIQRILKSTDTTQEKFSSGSIVFAKKSLDGLTVFTGPLTDFLDALVYGASMDNQDKYQLHTEIVGETMRIKELVSLEINRLDANTRSGA